MSCGTRRSIDLRRRFAFKGPGREHEFRHAFGVVKVQMGEKQAGQLLRFEGSDLSTVRWSARLRVSPKAWATVDNVRLTVDDNCDGDSAVTRVGRRRPTAEYDDLGYVGCRIVPPIRLAERRPFSAAGSRLVLDYLLGNCRIEQEKS